jgi:hypothetical protein
MIDCERQAFLEATSSGNTPAQPLTAICAQMAHIRGEPPTVSRFSRRDPAWPAAIAAAAPHADAQRRRMSDSGGIVAIDNDRAKGAATR